MSEKKMETIGGLWLQESKKTGQKYFSGSLRQEEIDKLVNLGPGQLMVFRNEQKKSDRHPDYRIVWAEKTERKAKDEVRESPKNDDLPF